MRYQEQREQRCGLSGAVAFLHGAPEASGLAQWRDVSRAGASMVLGRYLRPGRELLLEFQVDGRQAQLRARVVWCGALRGGSYAAGLAVYRDCPESALAFSALGAAARAESAGSAAVPCGLGAVATRGLPTTKDAWRETFDFGAHSRAAEYRGAPLGTGERVNPRPSKNRGPILARAV